MKGKSAIDLAAEILIEFGGIDGVRRARFEELSRWPGIGPAKAASVIAGLTLGGRSDNAGVDRVVLRSADDVARVASAHLAGLKRERVIALVCDSRNVLRKVVVISEGAVDRSMFPVREILNAVLRNDGRAFAIAHNHPSGDVSPSTDDEEATRRIVEAAKISGLRFLGHVIVGCGSWTTIE